MLLFDYVPFKKFWFSSKFCGPVQTILNLQLEVTDIIFFTFFAIKFFFFLLKYFVLFSETDLIPAFATFFCCLFWALEWGILVGVGIQVLLILYHVARPGVNVDLRKLNGFTDAETGQFLFVTLDRALIFPSVTYVR